MSKIINWTRVLDQHGIEYVDRGKNVKRGEVNLKCPWCGAADPSHHMGLNLQSGYWACWRNQAHRGKSPLRLLVRLLGISYAKACEIAGIGADYVDPDGFDAVASRLLRSVATDAGTEEIKTLALPSNFKTIKPKGSSYKHWSYLYGRKFHTEDIEQLCEQYQLMASTDGPFKDRVIIPFIIDHAWVSWTGRDTTGSSALRYRDLSVDDSVIPPKTILYNLDATLYGGKVLIVQEGQFDVLKMDFYGQDWGVRSVGLSTNAITDAQIYQLEEASSKFSRTIIMMDSASSLGVVDSMRMKEKLSQIRNLSFSPVPFNFKDAGEMPPSLVVNYVRSIT